MVDFLYRIVIKISNYYEYDRTNVSPVVTVRCLHLAVLAAGCRKENRANELRRSWEFVYQSSIWGGTSWGQANSAVWFTWYAVEKGALFSCFVCTSFALKNSIRTRMDRGHRKHLWYPFKTAIGLWKQFQSKSLSHILLYRQLVLFGKIARMPDNSVMRKCVFIPQSIDLVANHGRKQGRPRNASSSRNLASSWRIGRD